MAVSRNTKKRRRSGTPRWIFEELSRHDLVLALIPLVLAIPVTVYAVLSVSLHQSIAVGSVAATLLVVDALFVHPPAARLNGPRR